MARIRNIGCRPYYSGIEPVTYKRVEIHIGEIEEVTDVKAAQIMKDYPGKFELIDEHGEVIPTAGAAPAASSTSDATGTSDAGSSPGAPVAGTTEEAPTTEAVPTEVVAKVLADPKVSEAEKQQALEEEEDFGGPPRRRGRNR